MEKLYDGINSDARAIAAIIQPGEGIAYYIDGRYAWGAAELSLFPVDLHPRVTITVRGNPADVADCETGDLTPEETAAWIIRQKAAGYFRPTAYRSLSVMGDLRRATGNLVMGKDWDAWVADYDNDPHQVYPGAIAHQYRSNLYEDISSVFDKDWPHRKPPGAPKPPVITGYAAPKWPSGLLLKLGNVGHAVEAMQTALRNSGEVGVRGIAADGRFGNQTLTSLRNFQENNNLQVDGIAGNQTRTKLITLHLLNIDGSAA
jgi:peptidoglycan hydrolase-like protein with peptidoglycan-binding domain